MKPPEYIYSRFCIEYNYYYDIVNYDTYYYNQVAEFEMNEFRDYDKAAAAMQNAVKFMHDRQKKDGKMGWTKLPKKQDELANLKQFEEKLHHVSEFVKVQVHLVASVVVRNVVSCGLSVLGVCV